MKREEKNQLTKRRIMERALTEFSAQGYGASSINTICAAEDISKGIVYHYFPSKDALFLACVHECFERLTAYIQENLPSQNHTAGGLEDYFAIRSKFFYAYPVYQRIFCEAVVSPPAHLRGAIHQCRQNFDALNIQILERLLAPLSLREGFSKEEVIEVFRQFQDFINIHNQVSRVDGQTFAAYEASCRKTLDVLLYGIIKRKHRKHD